MTKTSRAAAALLLFLIARADTAHAFKHSTQDGGAQNTSASTDCRKVEPSEIIRGIYLQVWGRPAEPKAVAELEAKLVAGQLSVKETVRLLALSDEFKSRFVTDRGVEEAVGVVHERLLARAPRPEEAARLAESARSQGFDSVINSIIDGPEYGDLFGEAAVPGRPVSLRVCGGALRLERRDAFGEGQQMTTALAISESGSVEGVTKIKNSAAAAREFCGRVALWLFDEHDNVFEVVGPPVDQLWCVKGGDPNPGERQETWGAQITPGRFGRLKAVAVIHTRGETDPGNFTRENIEKARKTKRRLR